MIFKWVLFNDFHSMLLQDLRINSKTVKKLPKRVISFIPKFYLEKVIQIPTSDCLGKE